MGCTLLRVQPSASARARCDAAQLLEAGRVFDNCVLARVNELYRLQPIEPVGRGAAASFVDAGRYCHASAHSETE